ncbi:MAG: flagellar basal body P-ring formation protein FlgA [Bdellovibrionales bacterium]|nr:flagellar basal body P-ring formation protein FlgA [Bdellovibrionales bacterium]
MSLRVTCVVLSMGIVLSSASYAADQKPSLAEEISSKIVQQLSDRIPNARVKLPSLTGVAKQSPLSEIEKLTDVRFIEDKASGVAVAEVIGTTEGGREVRQVIQTPYEAWVEVPTAIQRIYPNTKLKTEDFKISKINVASGIAREYRGVMVGSEADLNKMESRQTILENQFVTRNAVQKQPDIRKGEMVKLELTSGDLSLVTQAIVQESGLVGDRIHVLTLKTKKEIVGKLRADHSIEVNL